MTPAEALEALAARLDELAASEQASSAADLRYGYRSLAAFNEGRARALWDAARLARTRAAELRQEEPVEVNLDHEAVREAARQSVALSEVTP